MTPIEPEIMTEPDAAVTAACSTPPLSVNAAVQLGLSLLRQDNVESTCFTIDDAGEAREIVVRKPHAHSTAGEQAEQVELATQGAQGEERWRVMRPNLLMSAFYAALVLLVLDAAWFAFAVPALLTVASGLGPVFAVVGTLAILAVHVETVRGLAFLRRVLKSKSPTTPNEKESA